MGNRRGMTAEDARYVSHVMNIFNAIEVTGGTETVRVERERGESNVTTGSTPTLPSARQLVQEQRVPFWTGVEDPRNKDTELVVIEYFLRRPNTLSIRDVRAAQIPWSLEVVGKRRNDVQHVRILCDQEAPDDVLNLPFEVDRVARGGEFEQVGWGDHPDVDFLLFVSAQSWVARLVSRERFSRYLLEQQEAGVKYPDIHRRVPRDPLQRTANGFLVPIIELEDAGVILDTWHLGVDE